MKKLFFIATCLFLAQGLSAQVENDKALHFLGGNLYGLAGAGIAKQISDGNRWWTFAGAIGGSALIGIGKEAVDSSQRPNGWDNDDLLATILGGTTVGFTIDIFTDHKKKKEKQMSSITANKETERYAQVERLEALLKVHPTPSLTALSVPFELLILD
ncbi:MAG: hypothetical protein AAF634_11720 [Bacteroidota bacterium]